MADPTAPVRTGSDAGGNARTGPRPASGDARPPRTPCTVGRLRIRWEAVSAPRSVRGRKQDIAFGWFDSPFGDMLVLALGPELVGLAFRGDRPREDVFRSMTARQPQARYRADRAGLANPADTLCRTGSAHLRLSGTERQLEVWSELLAIPKGETRSYRDLARRLGTPRGPRWIGQANAANPVAWLVPCHRVVGNDGRLAGYAWGTSIKRALLAAEGVQFAAA